MKDVIAYRESEEGKGRTLSIEDAIRELWAASPHPHAEHFDDEVITRLPPSSQERIARAKAKRERRRLRRRS